jgi:hypothetical protein
MVTLLPSELDDDFSFNVHIKINANHKSTYLEGIVHDHVWVYNTCDSNFDTGIYIYHDKAQNSLVVICGNNYVLSLTTFLTELT